MILVKTIADLEYNLQRFRLAKKEIGFVPTMGALHAGHISLIGVSRKRHPVTVCSIFVNPTQFNNSKDFDKYPITIENDINLLEEAGCAILFMPSVAEMYPPDEPVKHFPLGFIETVLEGEFRPGHFQGVCRIVDKLLNAVRPTTLFLGQKDYQQCMVVRKMMEIERHTSLLRVCGTVREEDGLAMSSRNMRLTADERKRAGHIIKALKSIAAGLKPGDTAPLKTRAFQYLESNGFKVDYVEIADRQSLTAVEHWDGGQPLVALVAAFLNEIRLIDNLLLTSPQPA